VFYVDDCYIIVLLVLGSNPAWNLLLWYSISGNVLSNFSFHSAAAVAMCNRHGEVGSESNVVRAANV